MAPQDLVCCLDGLLKLTLLPWLNSGHKRCGYDLMYLEAGVDLHLIVLEVELCFFVDEKPLNTVYHRCLCRLSRNKCAAMGVWAGMEIKLLPVKPNKINMSSNFGHLT